MTIHLTSVIEIFENVLSGKMSRDEADRWAGEIVHKSEYETVMFIPQKDREAIWDAVMFLFGIDMPNFDKSFLHSDDDIRKELVKLERLL